MNQTYKYTWVTLFLAAAFIFGSMAGMNIIFQTREAQLLGAGGTAPIAAPVREWQQPGEVNREEYLLNVRQMEDVIRNRNDYTEEVIHDPVKGQISIEKAIEEGNKWLIEMGMEENNKGEMDSGMHFVNAILGVRGQKDFAGAQLEPYYSFWTVQFSSQSMNAVLYINAVTGRVWNAELTLYEHRQEEFPCQKLGRFLELAGLPKSAKVPVEVNDEGTQAVMKAEGSRLYARMESYDVNVDKKGIVDYAEPGTFKDKYRVITYDLQL